MARKRASRIKERYKARDRAIILFAYFVACVIYLVLKLTAMPDLPFMYTMVPLSGVAWLALSSR